MAVRKRYTRCANSVTAVQIRLDLIDFRFTKWGAEQSAKQDDWLVDSKGDVYIVDNHYFNEHYQKIGPGEYTKTGDVWAQEASDSGYIATLEGKTAYSPGDYLVFDAAEGGDAYAVAKARFEQMYSLAADN